MAGAGSEKEAREGFQLQAPPEKETRSIAALSMTTMKVRAVSV